MMLLGCEAQEARTSCGRLPECLSGAAGYAVGKSLQDRRNALRELEEAALAFERWGLGPAPRGVIVLDSGARGSAELPKNIAWVLVWTPTEADSLRAALGRSHDPASAASQTALDQSPIAFDADPPPSSLQEDGATLVHEICHRYATAVYGSKRQHGSFPPEVLGEMAALSCEPSDVLVTRRRAFSDLLDEGSTLKALPQFFTEGHPLKRSASLQAALSEFERAGQSTIRFRLDPSSQEAEATAVYYGQTATFLEFLISTSCLGTGIVGRLLSSWSDDDTVSSWLARNGGATCLPATMETLSIAFAEYVSAERRS